LAISFRLNSPLSFKKVCSANFQGPRGFAQNRPFLAISPNISPQSLNELLGCFTWFNPAIFLIYSGNHPRFNGIVSTTELLVLHTHLLHQLPNAGIPPAIYLEAALPTEWTNDPSLSQTQYTPFQILLSRHQ